MEARAITRGIRLSSRKARLVIDVIRGKSVSEALKIVSLSSKKAARPIRKTLESAIANAENNNNLNAASLVVKEAVVGEGATFKRSQPKARGSAGPIRKRTSHIRIILTDEIEIKRREPAAKTKKPRAKKPAATPAPAATVTETSAPAADSKE